MTGHAKAHYLLMATSVAFTFAAVLSGDGETPDLSMTIWSVMFMVLSLTAPIIYAYSKASYDIDKMSVEELINLIREHHDQTTKQ